MPTAAALDYSQLTDRLADSPLSPTAAEAHGMLCGLICAGEPRAETVWMDELFADSDEQDLSAMDTRRSLQALAERAREEIEGAGAGFSPFLPEDDCPLRERALGLYDWTRGFIFGMGVAGLRQDDLSEQGREVFADFAEITRLDLHTLDEGEDNEEALAELQEFIWVAAMLVYEERRHAGK